MHISLDLFFVGGSSKNVGTRYKGHLINSLIIYDNWCIETETYTMFPLYRIDFYNVVKSTRYNGNRIWHITLYNIRCFH